MTRVLRHDPTLGHGIIDEPIPATKHGIVKELFFKTADQTYVVARWCFLNGLYLDFYWNALHALEKYLRAVLLLMADQPKCRPTAPPIAMTS